MWKSGVLSGRDLRGHIHCYRDINLKLRVSIIICDRDKFKGDHVVLTAVHNLSGHLKDKEKDPQKEQYIKQAGPKSATDVRMEILVGLVQ